MAFDYVCHAEFNWHGVTYTRGSKIEGADARDLEADADFVHLHRIGGLTRVEAAPRAADVAAAADDATPPDAREPFATVPPGDEAVTTEAAHV